VCIPPLDVKRLACGCLHHRCAAASDSGVLEEGVDERALSEPSVRFEVNTLHLSRVATSNTCAHLDQRTARMCQTLGVMQTLSTVFCVVLKQIKTLEAVAQKFFFSERKGHVF